MVMSLSPTKNSLIRKDKRNSKRSEHMKKVSILVPCYNEEASLQALYEALRELMDRQSDYQWEVLMVNDGSKDNTIQVIKQLRDLLYRPVA